MMLNPNIAEKHEEYKKKQCKKKQQERKRNLTPEGKTRAKAVLYCSALNTGKILKINSEKLLEHKIKYDHTAGRFVC